MPSAIKKISIVGISVLLLAGILAGCKAEHAIPLSERKPGTDLTASARADKRGDVK